MNHKQHPVSQGNEPTETTTKPRRWLWLVGIVAALGLGYGAGVTSVEDAKPAETTEAEQPEATTVADDPEPESEAEPQYDEPTADSFLLTVKTLSKQCFGSAGCNVDFRIEVTAADPLMDLDPAKTYELTYEIEGSEDPYINTLTIEGDGYTTDQEEFVGTASDVELVAVVTDVTEF